MQIDSSTAVTGHRQRLIDAMAAALQEQEYSAVTVADVVRRARTSRRTFYENFADKQECFVALLDETTRRIADEIATAVDPAQPWPTMVRQAMTAWARACTRQRAVTLNWIRVTPSLGQVGRDAVRRSMTAYGELLHGLTDTPELAAIGIAPPSPQVTTLLLGGLRELIATTVEDGDDVESIIDVATDVALRVLAPAPVDLD